MVSFGLTNNMYGVETQTQLAERCKAYETTVCSQEIASYNECVDYVCMGGTIETGVYLLEGGLLEIEEDGELEFIDLRIAI